MARYSLARLVPIAPTWGDASTPMMPDALHHASTAEPRWPLRLLTAGPAEPIAWGEISADQADGFAPDDADHVDDCDCGYGFGV
jgi:hypothetical protein